jgi:small neutral amino acid transporter SnatA (MarC family)
VWERLRHPFDSPEEPPAVVPLALPPLPGPLEARVVPTLNDAIASLLRVIAFLCGTLLMILGLYYRSVTDLILQLRALRRRVSDVERKVDV